MTPASLTPRVRWAVWAAMLSSIGVYAGILFAGFVETPGPDSAETLRLPLSIAGFVLAVTGVGIRMVVRNARDASGRRSLPPWADPAFFAALALSESSAIFGLVLGFLGADWRTSLPLLAVGALAMLSNHPAAFFARHEDE